MYRQDMEKLRTLGKVNEPLMVKIVDMFKTQQGSQGYRRDRGDNGQAGSGPKITCQGRW